MSKSIPTAKIAPADIEAKFRDLQDQVERVADDSKKKVVLGGLIGAAVLLLIIYLMGQRAGKRRRTVLQIRRL